MESDSLRLKSYSSCHFTNCILLLIDARKTASEIRVLAESAFDRVLFRSAMPRGKGTV